MPSNKVYLSFQHLSKGRCSSEIGPFDFVQLTYEYLRVGPNGDGIAYRNEHGLWVVDADESILQAYPQLRHCQGKEYSDVVIYVHLKAESSHETVDGKAAEALAQLGHKLNDLAKRCSEDEKSFLKDLWVCLERYLYLVAWLRILIDQDQSAVDAWMEIQELFEGGEDDFERYCPSVAEAYRAVLESERALRTQD